MKNVLLLSIILTTTGATAAYGQSVTQLIAQLQDPDWTVRSSAFNALKQIGFNSSDQLKVAVIGLLATENANTNIPDDGTEGYGEYVGDVIGVVTQLNDPRSITALVGAIDTGNMAMNAIANFGTAALGQVIQQLYNSEPTVRISSVLTIGKMIDANLVSDPSSKLMIASALATASTDPNYYVALFSATGLQKLSQKQVAVSPLSGSQCSGFYNGAFNGNVTVSAGQDCVFVYGGVTGNVQVSGGSLTLIQSYVGGNVQINGGGTFTIGTGSTINGNLQIQSLPSGSDENHICGTIVKNNLQFQNNGTAVEIGSSSPGSCAGNTVGNDLTVQYNSAVASAVGNTVGNNLTVQNNSGATVVNSNHVTGNLQDQNNSAATQVFTNVVGNNLLCQQDSSITGGGDTAKSKQGQCAAF